MRRTRRLALSALLLFLAAGEARAQWGYGYYPGGYGGYGRYGWGGWGGGTVQGSIARGLGYYAMGLGQYNLDTAAARSINANTSMRWNQYWWEAQVNANRAERERLARRQARDAAAGDAVEKRVRENPTADDIESGNALNAALDEVTDPRVQSSALRLATTKVPGKVVRDIPFVNASEAVSISLNQMTGEANWPAALRDPMFNEDRKAYSDAIHQALEEDLEGDIRPETIAKVRAALGRLRERLVANPPQDPARNGEALGYVKTLYGFTRMLERPDVEKIIAELESIQETTLGSLLGFMSTFNLRFGRPTTPSQRAAYAAIWPPLDDLRDRVVAATSDAPEGKAGGGSNAPATTRSSLPPPDFSNALGFEHLEGPHRVQGAPK